MRNILAAAAAAALLLVPVAAGAQSALPLYGPSIGHDAAQKAIAASEAEAKKNGWMMVTAVVDTGGHLVALSRMDNSQMGSLDIAIAKATTANNFKRPSKAFQEAIAQGGASLRLIGGARPATDRRRRAHHGRGQDHRRDRRVGRGEQPGRPVRHGWRRGRRRQIGRLVHAHLAGIVRPPRKGRTERGGWRMAAFGKAQYIKRVEDDRLLTGNGSFADNLSRPNQVQVVLVRSPQAHARIVKIEIAAARQGAGRGRGLQLGRHGEGRRAVSPARHVPQCRRQEAGDDAAPGDGARNGALCRRAGGGGRGRDPRPGAGCRRAGRGRVRHPAGGHRDRRCAEARCAADLAGRARQPGRLQPLRRSRQGRGRVPGGSACRDARHRASAADRERDGAARGDGRMGWRPHDRAYRQPEPARHARHAVRRRSSACRPTRCACWCATSAAASA